MPVSTNGAFFAGLRNGRRRVKLVGAAYQDGPIACLLQLIDERDPVALRPTLGVAVAGAVPAGHPQRIPFRS